MRLLWNGFSTAYGFFAGVRLLRIVGIARSIFDLIIVYRLAARFTVVGSWSLAYCEIFYGAADIVNEVWLEVFEEKCFCVFFFCNIDSWTVGSRVEQWMVALDPRNACCHPLCIGWCLAPISVWSSLRLKYENAVGHGFDLNVAARHLCK